MVLIIVHHLMLIIAKTTFIINGNFGAPEKKFSINLSKAKTKFHFKFKSNDVNFPNTFCLGSKSNKFDYVRAKEVSLKIYVYNSSVDYGAIDKSDILKIHRFLMVKHYITWCSGLFNKCSSRYWVLVDL